MNATNYHYRKFRNAQVKSVFVLDQLTEHTRLTDKETTLLRELNAKELCRDIEALLKESKMYSPLDEMTQIQIDYYSHLIKWLHSHNNSISTSKIKILRDMVTKFRRDVKAAAIQGNHVTNAEAVLQKQSSPSKALRYLQLSSLSQRMNSL